MQPIQEVSARYAPAANSTSQPVELGSAELEFHVECVLDRRLSGQSSTDGYLRPQRQRPTKASAPDNFIRLDKLHAAPFNPTIVELTWGRFCGLRPTLILATMCLLSAGCDSSAQQAQRARQQGRISGSTDASDPPAGQFVHAKSNPRRIITECVAAYRRLQSYSDRALMKLSYRLDGAPVADTAPLSVAWDGAERIGIDANSIIAGPVGDRWRLKLADEASPLTQQTISRSLPRMVSFAWLLDDPIVAAKLDSGPVGTPPQLELLFGERPLQELLDQTASIGLRRSELIDGRACHVLEVSREGIQFVFWIDKAKLLIRRIQLPKQNLPPAMLTDSRVGQPTLTIELEGIATDEPINWQRFQPQVQPNEYLVSRFVPPPAPLDTHGLNVAAPAFELLGFDGHVAVNSAEENRHGRTLVMVWLADHPACQAAAEQLSRVQAQLLKENPTVLERLTFVAVWAEPQPPSGISFQQLSDAWSLPGVLAIDTEAMGRDLFAVQEAPTLIVLNSENRLQLREVRVNPEIEKVLPTALTRIANGESLAEKLLADASRTETRFQTELSKALAIDNRRGAELPASYPPSVVQLRLTQREKTHYKQLAATSAVDQSTWILADDQRLRHYDTAGQVVDEVSVPWLLAQDTATRIEISPDSRYIAIARFAQSQLEILNLETGENREIELGASEQVVDFHWLSLPSAHTPRLAAITSDRRAVLLDPSDQVQLSGRCAGRPVAILSGLSSSANNPTGISGRIVMADGSADNLLLEEGVSELAPSAAVRLVQLTKTTDIRAVQQLAGHVERASAGVSAATSFGSGTSKGVSFQPDTGPWLTCLPDRSLTLARGWVARDEPALFMLGPNLETQMHVRMPLAGQPNQWTHSATAADPASGLACWAYADPQGSVHLIRADGLTDHFRQPGQLRGLALLPVADRLSLRVIFATETIDYDVRW